VTDAVAIDESSLATLAGRIDVWSWNLDAPHDASVLSHAERERAARFVFEHDRRRWSASRALLRHTLGRILGREASMLEFALDPNGKPRLVGVDDLHFSLSRSRDRGLLAVTQCGPVGADVEVLRPVSEALDIARRMFAPDEARALAQRPPDERAAAFLTLWVSKEAIVKASGVGITARLDAFALDFADDGVTVRVLDPEAPPMPAKLRLLPLEDAFAAIAGPDAPLSSPTRSGHLSL
jgi:4'-phosphopantetheinyl transferase